MLVVGSGGIGSWVAFGLAQAGVNNIILCDPDQVKAHNLNRSLFFWDDIGELKVDAVRNKIESLNPTATVEVHNQFIDSETQFSKILNGKSGTIDLVVNAADMPNVDVTSGIIARICTKKNIPHIIAGGYNLHLSIIGPTIIPFESACYKCIEIGLEEIAPDDLAGLRKLERKNRNIGNVAPMAGISASFTINEAIRLLVKSERLIPHMLNKRGEFNFLTNTVNFSEFKRRRDCPWCNSAISGKS